MKKNTIETLQVGRGLAALSVLLFHTNITLNLKKYIGRDIFPIFNGGYLGVAFFFVLSGFVIFLAHERDINQPHRFTHFIFRRFQRIYPLLWSALAFSAIGMFIAFRTFPSILTFLNSALTLPSEYEKMLAVEWTLRHEALFYLFFSILIISRKFGTIALGLWFALSLIFPFFEFPFPLNYFFDSYHLLFGMGMTVCFLYSRNKILYPISFAILGTVAFCCLWCVLAFEVLPKDHLSQLLVGLGASFAVAGFVDLERRFAWKMPSALIFLGESSYAVYLIHFLVISMLCKIFARFSGVLPDELLFAFVAGGSLCVGIAFHLAVEKPLMAALRKLKSP